MIKPAELLGGAPPKPTAKQGAHEAATQLEAYFLRQMMSEVRGSSSEGGLLDGGFAGSTFKDMLDGALADSMAKSGGIGIGKVLEKEMEKSLPKSATSAHLDPTALRAPSSSLMSSSKEPGSAPLVSAGRAVHAYGGEPLLTARPVDGELRSNVGQRIDPIDGGLKFHAGLDLAAKSGTPVHAAGAGVVVRAEAAGGYGNLVVVDHGDGVETRYAHLEHIGVKVGDRIAAGGELGLVGSTGRTTGPHLHLEVRQDGQIVDPKTAILPLKGPR